MSEDFQELMAAITSVSVEEIPERVDPDQVKAGAERELNALEQAGEHELAAEARRALERCLRAGDAQRGAARIVTGLARRRRQADRPSALAELIDRVPREEVARMMAPDALQRRSDAAQRELIAAGQVALAAELDAYLRRALRRRDARVSAARAVLAVERHLKMSVTSEPVELRSLMRDVDRRDVPAMMPADELRSRAGAAQATLTALGEGDLALELGEHLDWALELRDARVSAAWALLAVERHLVGR